MYRKSVLLFAVVILIGLFLSACSNTTTTQQKEVVCQTIKNGTNLRIITVTSKRYNWDKKQEDVVAELNRIISSGTYNIVSVKTFYSNEYLTSAEVKYSIGPNCEKPKLRFKLLSSKRYNWDKKQEDIKPQLDSIINSGKYNIFDVNTTMLEGYLVAAEVYYYEK